MLPTAECRRRRDISGARLGRVTVEVFACNDMINYHPQWVVNYTGGNFNLAQLETTASYEAGNLSGVDLTHVDLAGANFAGFNLMGANLTSATLTGADFAGAVVLAACSAGRRAPRMTSHT